MPPVITETLSDSMVYQVQYFERARFELHPEHEPLHRVLLGLLGTELQILSTTHHVMTQVVTAETVEAHVRNLRRDGAYARVEVWYLPSNQTTDEPALVFLTQQQGEWVVLTHGGHYLDEETLEQTGIPRSLWP